MARKTYLLATAATLLVASVLAGTALAGQRFADVPPEHPFHDEVEQIAEAGITTGYADGTYRPGDPVSRGAMAAFMGRGFGRAVGDNDGVTIGGTEADSKVVASAQVPAGATDEGQGYVLVVASARFSTDLGENSAGVGIELTDGTTTSGGQGGVLQTEGDSFAVSRTSLTDTWVFPLGGGATGTYDLVASLTDPGGGPGTAVDGTVSALYVPFGTATTPPP